MLLRLGDSSLKRTLGINDSKTKENSGKLISNTKKQNYDIMNYSFMNRKRSKEKRVKCVNIVRNVKLKNINKSKKHLYESTIAEESEL